jgi:uncharacterized protein with GYD domain
LNVDGLEDPIDMASLTRETMSLLYWTELLSIALKTMVGGPDRVKSSKSEASVEASAVEGTIKSSAGSYDVVRQATGDPPEASDALLDATQQLSSSGNLDAGTLPTFEREVSERLDSRDR